MNQIEREIYVTQKRLNVCFDITSGSDLLPIKLKVMDYLMPTDAIATAYVLGIKNKLRKIVCSINENEILFTPSKGFFDEGPNSLQIRITCNSKDLVSFEIAVRCQRSIINDNATETEDNPSLTTQLLSEVGVLSARLDEALSIPEGGTTADAALNDIKVGYDGTVYDTPGNAVREQVEEAHERIDANSIISTAQGETILVTDSAKVPPENIKLFGKTTQVTTEGNQLFDAKTAFASQIEAGLVIVNSNGSVTLNGTFTYDNWDCYITLPAGSYYFSEPNSILHQFSENSDGLWNNNNPVNLQSQKTFRIYINVGTYNNVTIYPMISTIYGAELEPYTYGQPSPSIDYPQELNSCGDDGNVKQALLGANLYNIYDKLQYNFEDCTIDDNDWCSVYYDNSTGNTTHYVGIQVKPSKYLKPNTEYLIVTETEYISGCDFFQVSGMEQATTQGQFINTFSVSNPGIQINKITTRDDFTGCVTMLRSIVAVNPGNVCRLKYRISVLADLSVTASTFVYEPYTEQTLTTLTPNGLPGLPIGKTILDEIKNSPIHMGGVYHDGEQYWIGDTIDYKNGKYTQRILKCVLDGSTAYGFDNGGYWHLSNTNIRALFGGDIITFADLHGYKNPSLSNYFITQSDSYGGVANEWEEHYNTMYVSGSVGAIAINAGMFPSADEAGFKAFFTAHPTEIYIIAEEPIETDLTSEELAQYKALCMNYPNTTITNDSEAYTEVEYVASPKEYIANLEKKHDNDIQQLKTAIIALGGTI